MIGIIQKHLQKYPKMQIQDIAKLLYQSEFGGGHMITNAAKSLERIQTEYLTLKDINFPSTIESIGDGMCRIYLNCLSEGMSAEVLNLIFVYSANHKKGTIQGFEIKLEQFLNACRNGKLPYSEKEATEFFTAWKSQGYPPISHTEIYRTNYFPAYRVIEASYAKIYEAIQAIEQGLKNKTGNHPFVVAIDGMCGSGKSTLGNLLKANFPDSNLFHMDDYFLQPHQRTEERLTEIGGNVDYERFHSEILSHLEERNGLDYHIYDCSTRSLGNTIHVTRKPLVIVEGTYSMHPYFGDIYDLCIFCEITEDEQAERILNRNGKEMLKRFQEEWIPKENQYFEAYEIREKVDSNNVIRYKFHFLF